MDQTGDDVPDFAPLDPRLLRGTLHEIGREAKVRQGYSARVPRVAMRTSFPPNFVPPELRYAVPDDPGIPRT